MPPYPRLIDGWTSVYPNVRFFKILPLAVMCLLDPSGGSIVSFSSNYFFVSRVNFFVYQYASHG